jgi:exo-beta-1,3-glucanase (GH17 family)
MMSNWLRALPRAVRFVLAPALAVLVAGVLVACGGGGYLPSPLSVTDPRPLAAEFLTRKAVSYSPYREATSESNLDDEVFTDEEILQDLQLIRGAGIGVIRLFSSRAFGDQVLRLIRTNSIDLKMMLGAYPNPVDRGTAEERAAAEADNQAELDEAIRLANTYSDIVLAVSVGNETMVYWSTRKIDPELMGSYILKVRQAIKQPVTTDDNWAFWASAPKAITDVVDFAAVHTYPLLDTFYDPTLWEWRAREAAPEVRAAAMADAAIVEAKRQFGESRAFLDRIGLSKLPMVIGETGWMAVDYGGDPALPYRVQAVNQKLYYDRLQDWVAEGRASNGPQTMFYFQAFDEQWKQADDGWGLFTRDRKARCVVQALNAPSSSWVYDTSQSCADSAAVYWVAPVYNPAITESPYAIFTDAVAPGLQTNPYESPTAGDIVDHAEPEELRLGLLLQLIVGSLGEPVGVRCHGIGDFLGQDRLPGQDPDRYRDRHRTARSGPSLRAARKRRQVRLLQYQHLVPGHDPGEGSRGRQSEGGHRPGAATVRDPRHLRGDRQGAQHDRTATGHHRRRALGEMSGWRCAAS